MFSLYFIALQFMGMGVLCQGVFGELGMRNEELGMKPMMVKRKSKWGGIIRFARLIKSEHCMGNRPNSSFLIPNS